MTLAFCVDDRGGLSFNRRRQSRDRAVSADLLSQAGECTLWVEPCSRPLFPEEAKHIRTAEEPWTRRDRRTCVFWSSPAPALPWSGRTSSSSTGGTGTTPPTGRSPCPRRAGP